MTAPSASPIKADPPDRRTIPAWDSAGLEQISAARGCAEHRLHPAAWMLDGGGALASGGIAVLTDSTLGNAIMTNVPAGRGIVTSHLHLELLRPVPAGPGELRCVAEQRALDESFGLAEGDV